MSLTHVANPMAFLFTHAPPLAKGNSINVYGFEIEDVSSPPTHRLSRAGLTEFPLMGALDYWKVRRKRYEVRSAGDLRAGKFDFNVEIAKCQPAALPPSGSQ